jgi:FkbM family methyltransferase
MGALNVIQKTLERLPIRGKGRLADLILLAVKPEELECHPLRDVTVFLKPSQRIERLMWAGAYERDLVEMFKAILKPGMTVLDVGANIGYFSAIAAGLVGTEGSVHSFEPVPQCFARLQRNLSNSRTARAYSYAVGNATGSATIHFNERELGWSSLLSNFDLDSTIEVKLITLDAWTQQEQIRKIDLIKLDAEGLEYRVLLGAKRVLRDFRPVIAAELNSECLKRDRRTPEDILHLLQSAEYRVFSFNQGVLAVPIEHSPHLPELRKYMQTPFPG